MNFENINAENRSQRIYRTRNQRCCSFCRRVGHNIRNCNSDRLFEFEMLCADTVRNIEILDDFKNWLLRNYIDNQLLIKAFAVRKFGVNSRLGMSYYVDLIAEYIFRTYKENTNLENTVNDNLESDLINLLGELINPIQREYQEIQDVEGIENILMNNFLTLMLFNSLINQIREEYNAANATNATNATNTISLVVDNNIDNYENKDEICKCSICWDDKELNNFVKLGCNHEFCKDCIIKTLNSDQINLHCCSICRTKVQTIISKTDAIKDEIAENIA